MPNVRVVDIDQVFLLRESPYEHERDDDGGHDLRRDDRKRKEVEYVSNPQSAALNACDTQGHGRRSQPMRHMVL